MKNKKKGFTLIELVIVIAIIAILLAIAIPRYQSSKNKAKEVAIKSNVSMLTTAALLKQSEMNKEESIDWKDDEKDHKNYVEQWPKNDGFGEYLVTITATNIEIKLGNKTLYNSSDSAGIDEKTIKGIVKGEINTK
ncbi:MAG: prepilin-type N-terminal cleavage/methylation domain-containing protein [Peptoniphilaceae bacterium]|nr:prepilin-type N-terminal cleavage/methylation domain-containing protein [Peptoniphilaceae bacterium]